MLAAENADIAAKQSKANPVKVTRAEIAALQERRENIAMGRKPSEPEIHLTAPLEDRGAHTPLLADEMAEMEAAR